jgi:hypothetical protein
VTGIALISTTGIVDPGTTQEGCSGMAIEAIQSSCKVSRIGLGILTDCGHTIMACSAVINDAGVIKYRADERSGVMADATILTGWYMRDWWFVDGETSAMT